MTNSRWPILVWKIPDGPFIGLAPFVNAQVAEESLFKTKVALTEEISRAIKEEDVGADAKFENVELLDVDIEVRPVYHELDGFYPTGMVVVIPVSALLYRNERGVHMCSLPLLDEEFVVYSRGRRDYLIRQYAAERLNRFTPNGLLDLLLLPAPQLDQVLVKIDKALDRKPPSAVIAEHTGNLPEISDRVPYDRALRRKTSLIPAVAWAREEEVRQLVSHISANKGSIILVGPRRSGKSAVCASAIAEVVARTKKAVHGQTRRSFWRTSPQRIVARARFLGEWQEACDEMVDSLQRMKGILWIEDFVHVLRVGGEGVEDSLGAYLQLYLQRGQLSIIAEATPQEYDALMHLLPGLAGLFPTLTIPEMRLPAAKSVMENFREHVRKHLGVTIEEKSVDTGLRLLDRHVKYESMPGKAVMFFSALAERKLQEQGLAVTEDDVLQSFMEKTGLPELLVRDELLLNEGHLREYFTARIIGQGDAVRHLEGIVKVFKAGLQDPERPISVLVFYGPTGVGKTAAVRALADYFFGSGQKTHPLVRLDMSEFQHPSQIDRLIGTDGKTPGVLVGRVRQRPFSVVLLDEIEKAHPAIFDALLRVLDEGMLVDRYGGVTDFRRTVIVMTTNLGSSLRGQVGFGDEGEPDYEAQIRKFFRPEFINRIDRLVRFAALDRTTIRAITEKELRDLALRQGLQRRGIHLTYTEDLIAMLAERGFDRHLGARPLQRAIEQYVVGAVARWLLHERKNNCTLQVGWNGEEVVLKEVTV
jgi:ATP-dependent Clp protease ATP-binding subunit ClpC